MFTIVYLPKFTREYKKLFYIVQEQVKKTIADLRINPFGIHLKTHKLKGRLLNLYSSSVNYSYRIIFEIKEEKVYLHSVGNHSLYDKF